MEQLAWPVACWYLPASQSSHAIELVDGCAEPPAHSVQLDAPFLSPYLPTSHALQDDAPDPLYVPSPQREHDDAPAFEKFPAAQIEHVVAWGPLYSPDSHSRQLSWPVVDWYVPAKHSEHALEPVRLAKNPAAHEVHALAPRDGITFPRSHGAQSSAESWRAAALPLSLRYVPAGHEVHPAAPVTLLYLPSPQMVQEVTPAALYVPTGQVSHPTLAK